MIVSRWPVCAASLLVACAEGAPEPAGSDPPASVDAAGPVVVQVVDEGRPREGLDVVFHDRSGRLLHRALTDDHGLAEGNMLPNGMVTVVTSGPLTIYRVQPGDVLELGSPDTGVVVLDRGTVEVELPAIPNATTYVGASSCGPLAGNSDTPTLLASWDDACVAAHGGSIDAMLTALDVDGRVLAIATLTDHDPMGGVAPSVDWSEHVGERTLGLPTVVDGNRFVRLGAIRGAAPFWLQTTSVLLEEERSEVTLPFTPDGFADGAILAFSEYTWRASGVDLVRRYEGWLDSVVHPVEVDGAPWPTLDAWWEPGGTVSNPRPSVMVQASNEAVAGDCVTARVHFVPSPTPGRNGLAFDRDWVALGPPEMRVFPVPEMPGDLAVLVPDRAAWLYTDSSAAWFSHSEVEGYAAIRQQFAGAFGSGIGSPPFTAPGTPHTLHQVRDRELVRPDWVAP